MRRLVKITLIGRDNLQEDTVGLEMLKSNHTIKFTRLIKRVYLGKKLALSITEAEKQSERQRDIPLINDALEKILVRTRNMQQRKKCVITIYIASVDIIKRKIMKKKLTEAIRNTNSMTQNVVTVLLLSS